MRRINPDSTALLLVDVINDFDFPDKEELLRHAVPAAQKIQELRKRMTEKGVPVIYVNDNFGDWQSDFQQQIERCTSPGCPGRAVATILRPRPEDYFVLKPKHSGFYSTSLHTLLRFLGVQTLIITGYATDICVVYTANDAYMRDYEIIVPSDCVAAESASLNHTSLIHIKNRLKGDVINSGSIE